MTTLIMDGKTLDQTVRDNHHAIVGIWHDLFNTSLYWLQRTPPHSGVHHLAELSVKHALGNMEKIYPKSADYYRSIYNAVVSKNKT